MSIEEEEDASLKELVTKTLHNKGVLGKIQAQLRASVFLALEDEFKDKNIPLVSASTRKLLATPEGSAAAALVQDFLQCLGLEFSLAVFAPESGHSVVWSFPGTEALTSNLNLSTEKDHKTPLLMELVKERKSSVMSHTEKNSNEIKSSVNSNNGYHSYLPLPNGLLSHPHALGSNPLSNALNSNPLSSALSNPSHSHALGTNPSLSHALGTNPSHSHALGTNPSHSHALGTNPSHSHVLSSNPSHSHALSSNPSNTSIKKKGADDTDMSDKRMVETTSELNKCSKDLPKEAEKTIRNDAENSNGLVFKLASENEHLGSGNVKKVGTSSNSISGFSILPPVEKKTGHSSLAGEEKQYEEDFSSMSDKEEHDGEDDEEVEEDEEGIEEAEDIDEDISIDDLINSSASAGSDHTNDVSLSQASEVASYQESL
nr:centrosomal protein 43-like isoform X2 [Procambarus clarkii]